MNEGWGSSLELFLSAASLLHLSGPRKPWHRVPRQRRNVKPWGNSRVSRVLPRFLRPGAADFEPINQNEPVFVSDFILTDPADPNSKIWWRSKTPVRMDASLGVDSLLGLVAFSMEQTHSTFFGQVPKGTIRFRKKLPETTPPSSFVIATETALVQVVPTKRTADFVVESFEDSTTVTVLGEKSSSPACRNSLPKRQSSNHARELWSNGTRTLLKSRWCPARQ